MEEIVHTYLHHAPTALRLAEIGLQVRDFNHLQEREAYGIGAAALIPWGSLFSLVNRGESIVTLADHYDVTEDLVLYRIDCRRVPPVLVSPTELLRGNSE